MVTAHQLALFLPAALLVAATPGANNILSLSNGARAGFAPTVLSLGGRFAAFAMLLVLVAVGLGGLLAASEVAFRVVKWVGVAYLAWLVVRLWRSPPPGVADVAAPVRRTAGRLARKEFLVAATNPKAVLLFTAFVPQFVRPGADPSAQILALGAAYIAVEFVAATGWAAAGALAGRTIVPAAARRMVDRGAAVLLAGAAVALATSRPGPGG